MHDRSQTAHLAGALEPADCYYDFGYHLSLRVIGHLADEPAIYTVLLLDAHHHGFPAVPDDRITRDFGNWIELTGAFRPSPIDDRDTNPDQAGYLTVDSIEISRRPGLDMRALRRPVLPHKTLTVYFPDNPACPTAAP
jgi:hypothetical protein